MYIMSKTKKYARRRRKNKTKKNRMMKGTITHDVKRIYLKKQSVVIKNNRFFNVVLPRI